MGLSPFKRCSTNYSSSAFPAPNPDPKRWCLLICEQFDHGYVLKVRYLDCTNFEGIKIMVYRGNFRGERTVKHLDPHFTPGDDSPIARFKPDAEGFKMARDLARGLLE